MYTSFTKNKSKVESLSPGVDRLVIRSLFGGGITPVLEVGHAYGVFLGSTAARDSEGNFSNRPYNGYHDG